MTYISSTDNTVKLKHCQDFFTEKQFAAFMQDKAISYEKNFQVNNYSSAANKRLPILL